jgi:hypothetical protein
VPHERTGCRVEKVAQQLEETGTSMESSQWVEVVTHPVTGQRTMLAAETEELLERQIEAWRNSITDGENSDQSVKEGVKTP